MAIRTQEKQVPFIHVPVVQTLALAPTFAAMLQLRTKMVKFQNSMIRVATIGALPAERCNQFGLALLIAPLLAASVAVKIPVFIRALLSTVPALAWLSTGATLAITRKSRLNTTGCGAVPWLPYKPRAIDPKRLFALFTRLVNMSIHGLIVSWRVACVKYAVKIRQNS